MDPINPAAKVLTELHWTRSWISVVRKAPQATAMQGQVSESPQKHQSLVSSQLQNCL